jgi:DNA-directed RNA polymerase specialized sigma24 family protein
VAVQGLRDQHPQALFPVAVETGRLPSVLGREYFRTRVTSERGYTFENSVIFVHDVEHCLEELDDFSREVIGWHVLQEFSLKETAHLMGCGQSAAYRGFLEALDRLSEIMLTHQLMTPVEAAEDVGDPEMRTCVS